VGKQADFLNDVADGAPELDEVPVKNTKVLNLHAARTREPQAVDELEEGSLAGAAAAEESNCFARINLKRNVRKNGARRDSGN